MTGQPEFSPEVIAKAYRLLGAKTTAGVDKIQRDPEHASIWWVVPSSEVTSRCYRVQSDWQPGTRTLTWITCTCPHGMNKGAGTSRCYHVAAVLMLIRDEQVAAEHQALGGESTARSSGLACCSCGWPTEVDFRMHTPKWRPRFAEHLLDERRKVN